MLLQHPVFLRELVPDLTVSVPLRFRGEVLMGGLLLAPSQHRIAKLLCLRSCATLTREHPFRPSHTLLRTRSALPIGNHTQCYESVNELLHACRQYSMEHTVVPTCFNQDVLPSTQFERQRRRIKLADKSREATIHPMPSREILLSFLR